eukprot:gene15618-17192_t
MLDVNKAFFDNINLHSSQSINGGRELALARAALLLGKTKTSNYCLVEYFTLAFKCYQICVQQEQQDEEHTTDRESEYCTGCKNLQEACCCSEIVSQFKELNLYHQKLGLVEYITTPIVSAVVYNQMKQYLELLCKNEFQKHYLADAMEWVENRILGWLKLIVGEENIESTAGEINDLNVELWRPKLEYFMCKVYADLRISQMFEMIVEFPDSLPAFEDLKECLEKTETRKLLTKSLKEAFTTRLLQPAVNTVDILTQYISTIRALRALDPAGVILENVCGPLREYLRSRDDTIRCIIMSLTDQESGTDLSEELIGSEPVPIDAIEQIESDSDGEDWTPEPVDANLDLSSKSQRTADIINILVNIYGSKDMFVSEYRTLLADRLLNNYSYDITNERRYLELLKRRFGESHLHFCDIMLKDVQDSQRMNSHIKEQMKKKQRDSIENIDFNAFILSNVYWPSFKDDQITGPEVIKSVTKDYTKEFEILKGMRTLEWIEHLGEVELDIELDDGQKSFKVTPAQATIILYFQNKENWTTEQLCDELKVNANTVRTRLSYWLNQGVIIEKLPDVFYSATSYQSCVKETSFYEPEDEQITFVQDKRDEELQMYWSYVVGMLTNIGALPLDRIHSMLKMFAMHDLAGSQCTLEDVKQFLESKVKDGNLSFANGLYKLNKN